MWLDTGINDQCITAPMFIFIAFIDAVNIMGWIASRKGYPEEVAEICGQKIRIVADND